MPQSGYVMVASLLRRDKLECVEHAMACEDGQDVIDLSKDMRVFIVTNKDPELCMWTDVLQSFNADDMLNPASDVEAQSDMLMREVQNRRSQWRFMPESYVQPFQRLFGVRVPTKPLGGIFLMRSATGQLVVSLDWERLPDAWPILEFVLDIKLDKRRLMQALTASYWYDGLLDTLVGREGLRPGSEAATPTPA